MPYKKSFRSFIVILMMGLIFLQPQGLSNPFENTRSVLMPFKASAHLGMPLDEAQDLLEYFQSGLKFMASNKTKKFLPMEETFMSFYKGGNRDALVDLYQDLPHIKAMIEEAHKLMGDTYHLDLNPGFAQGPLKGFFYIHQALLNMRLGFGGVLRTTIVKMDKDSDPSSHQEVTKRLDYVKNTMKDVYLLELYLILSKSFFAMALSEDHKTTFDEKAKEYGKVFVKMHAFIKARGK